MSCDQYGTDLSARFLIRFRLRVSLLRIPRMMLVPLVASTASLYDAPHMGCVYGYRPSSNPVCFAVVPFAGTKLQVTMLLRAQQECAWVT